MQSLKTTRIPSIWLLSISFIFFIQSCASWGAFKDGPKFEPHKSTDNNKALIYIYKAIAYGLGEYPVIINGKIVTIIKKGGYFPYEVEPGNVEVVLVEHVSDLSDVFTKGLVLTLIPDITHELYLNVKAGETYYIREDGGGEVDIEEVDNKDIALREISECHLLPEYQNNN